MTPDGAVHARLHTMGLTPQEARDFTAWLAGRWSVGSLKQIPLEDIIEARQRLASWSNERLLREIADWRAREAAAAFNALPSIDDGEQQPMLVEPVTPRSAHAWQSGLRGTGKR